jgi:(2R)-ethylmalonyl-CoA mutase
VEAALAELRRSATEGTNVMPASIACAKAGVTTGEWGAVFREVFGEYRAPTGVPKAARQVGGEELEPVRAEVERVSQKIGRRMKFLVGKPGLDGHSNGAEQIAVRARDCGMEVVYEGIRLTPERIVNAALEESVHVVGLSILSGGHVSLVADVMKGMRAAGIGDVPVVVGGIIPPADAEALVAAGVARVYTPKDFDLTQIMRDVVTVVDGAWKEAA